MEIVTMRSTILTLAICIAAGSTFASAAAPYRRHQATDFIRASCRSTRYPAICEQSLSAYGPAVRHSPRQLAHAAISVSAARAREASSFVSRLSAGSKFPRSHGGGAVHDCLEVLSDSVDRLRRSAREMDRFGRYGSPRFRWQLSNVETWTSAALTDLSTCLESLSEDETSAVVRPQIREKIVRVTQLISNALALVNRLSGRN